VSIGRHERLTLFTVAGVAALSVAGWIVYKSSHHGSFCQAVQAGASLEELTEYLRKHDPARLNSEGAIGSIEHTTTQPFACQFEIEGGQVVSAKADL
jgi:hypothetical protein